MLIRLLPLLMGVLLFDQQWPLVNAQQRIVFTTNPYSQSVPAESISYQPSVLQNPNAESVYVQSVPATGQARTYVSSPQLNAGQQSIFAGSGVPAEFSTVNPNQHAKVNFVYAGPQYFKHLNVPSSQQFSSQISSDQEIVYPLVQQDNRAIQQFQQTQRYYSPQVSIPPKPSEVPDRITYPPNTSNKLPLFSDTSSLFEIDGQTFKITPLTTTSRFHSESNPLEALMKPENLATLFGSKTVTKPSHTNTVYVGASTLFTGKENTATSGSVLEEKKVPAVTEPPAPVVTPAPVTTTPTPLTTLQPSTTTTTTTPIPTLPPRHHETTITETRYFENKNKKLIVTVEVVDADPHENVANPSAPTSTDLRYGSSNNFRWQRIFYEPTAEYVETHIPNVLSVTKDVLSEGDNSTTLECEYYVNGEKLFHKTLEGENVACPTNVPVDFGNHSWEQRLYEQLKKGLSERFSFAFSVEHSDPPTQDSYKEALKALGDGISRLPRRESEPGNHFEYIIPQTTEVMKKLKDYPDITPKQEDVITFPPQVPTKRETKPEIPEAVELKEVEEREPQITINRSSRTADEAVTSVEDTLLIFEETIPVSIEGTNTAQIEVSHPTETILDDGSHIMYIPPKTFETPFNPYHHLSNTSRDSTISNKHPGKTEVLPEQLSQQSERVVPDNSEVLSEENVERTFFRRFT